MDTITSFVNEAFWETVAIFDSMSPFLLFGLFVAGIIHVYVPTDKISSMVGKRSTMSVVKAALWGIPLPLCSCGVIPAALSLRKNGASKGATMSFLVSTPETGVDSIAVTYSLLDPIFTIFRPFAAFFTAMLTGLAENFTGRKEEEKVVIPDKVCTVCGESSEDKHVHTQAKKIGRIFSYAYVEFLGDIAKWLLLGIVAAGVITAVIPDGFITGFVGHGFLEMLVMLLAGIPLYICASATTPIAASLIIKGVSPGAALVFLLSGPATNAATITVVWKYLGRKSAIIYVLSIAVASLIMGALLNYIYYHFGLHPVSYIGECTEAIPHSIKMLSSWVLLALIVIGIVRGMKKKHEDHKH